MKAQKIIRQLLLVFVLISIGFALGREAGRRSVEKKNGNPAPAVATGRVKGDQIIAYYLHGMFRCTTCNKIEETAREVVHTRFAKELQDGRLEWKTGNFQEDETLAKRYKIAASTLVLIHQKDGKDIRFEKLDDVWKLVEDQPAFVGYVEGKIKSFLEESKK